MHIVPDMTEIGIVNLCIQKTFEHFPVQTKRFLLGLGYSIGQQFIVD